MAARLVEYRRSWYFYLFLPEWRNGRRGGLKIRCPQGRVGSTPSSGTTATFLEMLARVHAKRFP